VQAIWRGDFGKALLGMLLVAGVLALSLVTFWEPAWAEAMVSSWLALGFEGSVTASSEVYDYGYYTAAHPYLPTGTELEVCYAACTVVTVDDPGPSVGGRDLDLPQAAAEGMVPASWTWRCSGNGLRPAVGGSRFRGRRCCALRTSLDDGPVSTTGACFVGAEVGI
jgi:rare lipoprotein A